MIKAIVLKLGATLVVTAGFAPGAPVRLGNIFRVDQQPGTPVIFK